LRWRHLIQAAATHGDVVVGLLSDEAIESYKRKRNDRYRVIKELKCVSMVIPQTTHDYTNNLMLLRPSFVVHGTDWKTGVQSAEYTSGISTTDIIERCKN
jgi:phosphoenolpyruvate phosphomutase / 2-hydroxyethylphosphonate cytidylyltransferase